MVEREPPYPPEPRSAPADLGRWAGGSIVAVSAGLAGILFGLSLFAIAPVLAGWVAIEWLVADDESIILRMAGFLVCLAIAFVFLKSLLPRRLPLPPGQDFEVESTQPLLVAFVRRVADDIDAPTPDRLVIETGTSLRLAGRLSFASLVRGGTWDLCLGYWLLPAITLSELQALVARTLAPRSRGKLERFRFTARSLLDVLVSGEDAIDEGIATGRAGSGFGRLLRWVHLAISLPWRLIGRLMLWLDSGGERTFADDLVAVRVAGSDATVHAILRGDFAGQTLRAIDDQLTLAAQDGVFTRDLYEHVSDGVQLVRQAHNDFTLGEPPTLRGPTAGKHADVFEPGAMYRSHVWFGHPSPDRREHNAKKDFVVAERDDRPATELLERPQAARERLTRLRYTEVYGTRAEYIPLPPETVRRWINSRGEPIVPPEFNGCYDGGRLLQPGSAAERESALASEQWDDSRLQSTQAGLYLNAKERAETWRNARRAQAKLLRRTVYRPNGRDRALADDLEDDIRKTSRWLAALDRWAFVIHVHMAARLTDLTLHDALLHRYESVLRFQPYVDDARENRNRVEAFTRRLIDFAGVAPYRLVRDSNTEFAASRRFLEALLTDAVHLRDPLLQEWTGVVPLSEFLYARDEMPERGTLPAEQFGRRLLAAWWEVAGKALWLHRAGVTALLELHTQIAREFATKIGVEPAHVVPTLAAVPLLEAIPNAIVADQPAPIEVLPIEPEIDEPDFADEVPVAERDDPWWRDNRSR